MLHMQHILPRINTIIPIEKRLKGLHVSARRKIQEVSYYPRNGTTCRVYFRILPQRGSSKILGGGGGKYKAKEGQPHIKRTEKPIPRGGQTDPKGGGGKSTPWPPLK